MKTDRKSQIHSEEKIEKTSHRDDSQLDDPEQQSLFEQILIKNIDSGSYQVFDIEEVDYVSESKDDRSAQTRVSMWNSYWDEIAKNDVKLLKLILSKNSQKLSRILNEEPIDLNTFRYIDGWTLLHHAVVSSTLEIVKTLIQHKMELNTYSQEMKRTALHEAVLSNKIQFVQILLNSKADPNIQDIDGNTPAHYAAQMSYFQIFELLMKSVIQVDFTLKNNQQMTVLDCIRDQKLYKLIQSQHKQHINPNQNQHQSNQNRRVLRLEDGHLFQRYSKSDIIEKFLHLQKTNVYPDKSSLIQQQFGNNQMSESIESTSSSERKKKTHTLGKKPSHWIQKKGQVIALQSIYLMKESVLELHQNENQNLQSLANYEILRFVGSGGFAEVFLARKKKSSKLFAIKRINKSKILENNLKRYVYSQRNIMIKCVHPFIVQAYTMFQDQAHLYIAMEYCECGDVLRSLSQKGSFSETEAKLYAAQVGLALEYMHSKNILFRDLKTANVLIAKDGYVKVSDFGLAKQTMISFSFLGSVQYLAPQMLVQTQMKQHTKSIDWYLFGVLIYELITGRPPFYSEKQQMIFKRIKEQKPTYPSHLTKQCKILLNKLLQKDPSKRLGSKSDFEQIRSDEWFKEVDFEKLLRKQYDFQNIQPTVKEGDLRKKISIDNFQSFQKYEHFKQWNYTKQL